MSDFEWPPLPEWFWYAVVFCYGAIVGSFLNVVIYRLPLGKHLSKPPSSCPYCGHLITRTENIPLLSFLILRARCSDPDCRHPISWRYFCVELFTGCFWTLLYHQIVLPYQPITTYNFIAHALVASVLIALVFIDLDHFLAPDELTIAALVIGLARDAGCFVGAYLTQTVDAFRSQFTYFGWLPISVPGALAYGGLLFLVSLVGFVVYARQPGESFGKVFKRFFTFDEPDGMAVVGPGKEPESEDVAPPRMRFSPGFLCTLSLLIMAPVVQSWALLFFALPLVSFFFITRKPEETPFQTLQRFFRSDDLGLPGEDSEEVSAAEAEAEQFAREAETGQHGAMGLGDAKLALGIGAILGAPMAILSLVVATFLGALVGAALAKLRGRSLRYGVPFVPFMAAGAMIVMCFGPQMVQFYRQVAFPEERPAPIVRPEIRSPRRRQLMNLPPIPPGR